MSTDAALIDRPLSTANLVRPDRATLLHYARLAHDGADTVALLEERLARFHHARYCVTVCSGFWSLVLAMRALALPGRDDVVLPSLTYRRMADAVAWAGKRPRFCEVDEVSLACTPATMQAALAPEVGLLLAAHPMVGRCDAAGLEAFAVERRLPILFDSVEAVFEWVGDRKIGGFGAAECFSLHASKLVNGPEGGYVTTSDGALAARLAAMRDGRGGGGMPLGLDPLHAAMALAGLDGLGAQIVRNRARYDLYARHLAGLSGLRLLGFDAGGPCSFKTIVVELTPAWKPSRTETLARLNGRQMLARAYYHPALHRKTMGYPAIPASLPVTDRLAERFVVLPCGDHVGAAEIEAVASVLAELGG